MRLVCMSLLIIQSLQLTNAEMSGQKNVLFVVTSHEELETSGKKTGWSLLDVAHPYDVLIKAEYKVTFVSPKGGKSPMDPATGEAFKDDYICQQFLNHEVADSKLENTLKPSDVTASDYVAIFYAGGLGAMFDLPDNTEIAELASKIYENGGVVSAVSEGPVGLMLIKLSNGENFVKGKGLTSLTTSEGEARGLMKYFPFSLETRLKELGAKFESSENWTQKVMVSERLVTGQNPASAIRMADEMVKLMEDLKLQTA